MPDVWTFGGSGVGYYKFDVDTMVRSSLFAYPGGTPTLQQGVRPIADDTHVFASGSNTDIIFRVEIATDTFTRTVVGDQPRMIADDGTTLWVANLTDNDVSPVDRTTMVRGTDEAIVNSGVVLWVDPYLWVFEAGATSATFRVYDPATDTVVHTGTIVGAISDINDAVYYDGHVYVPVRFNDRLYKIDATTYSTVSSVAFGEGNRIIEVGGFLYVNTSSSGNQGITKIDPSNLSTVATLVGTYAQLTHNYVDTLWTVDNVNNLVKVDLNTFTVAASTAIGSTPTGIVYAAGPPAPPALSGWGVGTINW